MIDLPNFLKVVVSIGSQSSQPVKCVVQCFDEQDGGTAFLVDKPLRDMNAGQTPIVPNGTELNVLRIEDDGKLCFVRWLDAEGYVETRHLVPHDEHGHAGDASELSAMLEKSRSAGQQATSAKWFPRMYDIEKALNSFYDPALGTINIQQLNMMLTSLNGPDKLSTLDMAEAFFPVTDEQRSANKQNENRRRCEKQAILVLDELYTKQAGLVQDMAYVNEKYINKLKMEKGTILSNAEHDLIFRNWGALLQVHKELSDGIKIQAEDKVVGVWLPRIIDEFIKFLPKATDAMREFAKGVTPAEEAMDDLISRGNAASKNFKAFLDLRLKDSGAFRGGNAPRGLSSLMIAPIHSFLRYRLF